jgi:hypothetical protein
VAFAALLLFGNADWVTDSAASSSSLSALGKKADEAHHSLPGSIATYDLAVRESDRKQIGVAPVVGYETNAAPLYPPEDLFVHGTPIYQWASGQADSKRRAGGSEESLARQSPEPQST